jgi:hypothetical protein
MEKIKGGGNDSLLTVFEQIRENIVINFWPTNVADIKIDPTRSSPLKKSPSPNLHPTKFLPNMRPPKK